MIKDPSPLQAVTLAFCLSLGRERSCVFYSFLYLDTVAACGCTSADFNIVGRFHYKTLLP